MSLMFDSGKSEGVTSVMNMQQLSDQAVEFELENINSKIL